MGLKILSRTAGNSDECRGLRYMRHRLMLGRAPRNSGRGRLAPNQLSARIRPNSLRRIDGIRRPPAAISSERKRKESRTCIHRICARPPSNYLISITLYPIHHWTRGCRVGCPARKTLLDRYRRRQEYDSKRCPQRPAHFVPWLRYRVKTNISPPTLT
jgi:hypothetical protein